MVYDDERTRTSVHANAVLRPTVTRSSTRCETTDDGNQDDDLTCAADCRAPCGGHGSCGNGDLGSALGDKPVLRRRAIDSRACRCDVEGGLCAGTRRARPRHGRGELRFQGEYQAKPTATPHRRCENLVLTNDSYSFGDGGKPVVRGAGELSLRAGAVGYTRFAQASTVLTAASTPVRLLASPFQHIDRDVHRRFVDAAERSASVPVRLVVAAIRQSGLAFVSADRAPRRHPEH